MSLLSAIKMALLCLIFLLACLILWLLVFDGFAAKIVYNKHPKITRFNETGAVAFVYFTGAQSSGIAHSAPMRDLWATQGDPVIVEYNPKRFDAPTIVADTYEQLLSWGYHKLILDGASLGGLLVLDLIDYDRAHDNVLEKVSVIFQDVPRGAEGLVDQKGARAISHWHPGPVANRLLTKLFWHFGFNPPPREELGQGVDDHQLAVHYQASKTYPLSGETGELRYIVTHRLHYVAEYEGIPLIVMRSEHDGVVKGEAAEMWVAIFGGGQIITVPNSTHIAFVEFPQEWRGAFAAAFASSSPR